MIAAILIMGFFKYGIHSSIFKDVYWASRNGLDPPLNTAMLTFKGILLLLDLEDKVHFYGEGCVMNRLYVKFGLGWELQTIGPDINIGLSGSGLSGVMLFRLSLRNWKGREEFWWSLSLLCFISSSPCTFFFLLCCSLIFLSCQFLLQYSYSMSVAICLFM